MNLPNLIRQLKKTIITLEEFDTQYKEKLTEQEENVKGNLLTYSEVAERLSCSDRHVRYLCSNGELKTIKIGDRAIRISEEEYLNFVQKGY